MTQPDAVDAIMKVMQDFVDAERLKIWRLALQENKEWREKAERFIQHHIDSEKNTESDGLNQVYAKGTFAGASVRGVLQHARELLNKENYGV
ncbi:MAG TPA: hypothetical protein ENH82_12930 [bacterium]|nr:hypothetical protein [bacterium]